MEQPQKTAAGDNTFRFLVNVLSDYWALILAGTLGGVLLVGGASWLLFEVQRDKYESMAEVRILPSPWEKGVLAEIGGVAVTSTPTALKERTNLSTLAEETSLALVQADIQAGGPLSHVTSKEEMLRLAQQIETKIRLTPFEDQKKLRVTVTDCASKEEAEHIAEFATRVLLAQHQQMETKEQQAQHEFLKQELDRLGQQLRAATSKQWEYKQKTGFRNFGQVDENMAKNQDELEKLFATQKETQSKLKELDTELAQNTAELPAALGRVTEDAISGLRQQLDKLLQEKLTMSVMWQPGFQGIQDLDAEIEDQKTAILDAIGQLDAEPGSSSNVWKKRQDIYRQQMEMRVALTGYEVRIASLQRMLQEIIPKIPELVNEDQKVVELEQETARYRKLFQERHDQEWKLRLALSRGSGTVERQGSVAPASVIRLPSGGTSVWLNALIGGVLGLLCSFGFAMMLQANDTSIRSIEDVNLYIGLEVLGTIPKMRFGKPRGGRRRRATYVTTVDEEQIDACIVTQHDPKSPISEAYRTLRTNFQFATINQRPKTVMVTSAVPGEGKTTTAVNLAVTMADRGIRVLIVDTDMRRPNVHRVLRMERGPGMADVLREGIDIHSVIRATRVENLWIISSGRVPPNPSELIGSERMDRVMKQLAGEFDLVVCDAPSVLVVTDPVLLATHVETCVMVVSTNNARRETVIRAKKLLETAKVNVVGVVVNGLETGRRHYYYYYYYYDDGAPVRRKWYHFY